MKRLWGALVSMRTTAGLFVVLSALLLLNVVLPQASRSADAYVLLVRRGAAWRFALETLGFGRIATSAPFLAALAAFFLQLAAVLVDRWSATLRRARFAPPTDAQLGALLATSGAPEDGAPPELDASRATEVLEALGYRVAASSASTVWGVKHRFAVLGFPLFHASFFLLCAGGVQLYLTRHVVTFAAAEGQQVDTREGEVIQAARLMAPAPAKIEVEHAEVELANGLPIALAAAVRLAGPAGDRQIARVNHPARWGDSTLLVEKAGVAPVLWIQDARGFTRDRVAVLTSMQGGLATRLKPGDGTLEIAVEPIPLGSGFPEREALASVPIALRVFDRGTKLFEGTLRPGESLAIPGGRLLLQEVRYWVGMRLVSERGGGLLVAGFLLSVVGIAWRMLWFRREVAVSWTGGRLRVGGRAEFFPSRFAEELARIGQRLAALPASGGAPPPPRSTTT